MNQVFFEKMKKIVVVVLKKKKNIFFGSTIFFPPDAFDFSHYIKSFFKFSLTNRIKIKRMLASKASVAVRPMVRNSIAHHEVIEQL